METMTTGRGAELFGTAAEIKAALPEMDHAVFDAAFRRCIEQGSAAGAPVSVRFRTFEGPLLVAHDHLIEWGYESQSWTRLYGDDPMVCFSRDSDR